IENTLLVLAHGYAPDTDIKLFPLITYKSLTFYQWKKSDQYKVRSLHQARIQILCSNITYSL
ncbi:hypothetical protein EIV61_25705, partial [Salmonella enterica]|nr:hypothetical protein [Salmonella enterica]